MTVWLAGKSRDRDPFQYCNAWCENGEHAHLVYAYPNDPGLPPDSAIDVRWFGRCRFVSLEPAPESGPIPEWAKIEKLQPFLFRFRPVK